MIRPETVSGSFGMRSVSTTRSATTLAGCWRRAHRVRITAGDGERRGDECSVFIASYAPRPRMIVSAPSISRPRSRRIGSFLGYHVTVCDARAIFATTKRFPDADEVVVEWPHRYLAAADVDERTVVCVLTHDPKFDVPLLEAGACGSHSLTSARWARGGPMTTARCG